MTKERLKEQVTELLLLNMKANIETTKSLVSSGAIDFSEEPDGSWSTAKTIVSVVLGDSSALYKPTVGKPLADYRNLLKF